MLVRFDAVKECRGSWKWGDRTELIGSILSNNSMCNVKLQDDEAILDENLKSCSFSIDRSKELIDKGKLSSHHTYLNY